MKKTTLGSLLIMLITLYGCADFTPLELKQHTMVFTTPPSNYTLYTSTLEGFSIYYPEGYIAYDKDSELLQGKNENVAKMGYQGVAERIKLLLLSESKGDKFYDGSIQVFISDKPFPLYSFSSKEQEEYIQKYKPCEVLKVSMCKSVGSFENINGNLRTKNVIETNKEGQKKLIQYGTQLGNKTLRIQFGNEKNICDEYCQYNVISSFINLIP